MFILQHKAEASRFLKKKCIILSYFLQNQLIFLPGKEGVRYLIMTQKLSSLIKEVMHARLLFDVCSPVHCSAAPGFKFTLVN